MTFLVVDVEIVQRASWLRFTDTVGDRDRVMLTQRLENRVSDLPEAFKCLRLDPNREMWRRIRGADVGPTVGKLDPGTINLRDLIAVPETRGEGGSDGETTPERAEAGRGADACDAFAWPR